MDTALAKTLKKKKNNKVAVDAFYNNHTMAYTPWLLLKNELESSTLLAHSYFNYRMFVDKDMRVIADTHKVHEMAVGLHRYYTGAPALTALEISIHGTVDMV
jgi:hypothetical protein